MERGAPRAGVLALGSVGASAKRCDGASIPDPRERQRAPMRLMAGRRTRQQGCWSHVDERWGAITRFGAFSPGAPAPMVVVRAKSMPDICPWGGDDGGPAHLNAGGVIAWVICDPMPAVAGWMLYLPTSAMSLTLTRAYSSNGKGSSVSQEAMTALEWYDSPQSLPKAQRHWMPNS